MPYPITTQKQLRAAFWKTEPYGRMQLKKKSGKTQNDYPADTRVQWCDFIDALCRDGVISQELAQRATL